MPLLGIIAMIGIHYFVTTVIYSHKIFAKPISGVKVVKLFSSVHHAARS
jgi:hypothetical protein